MLLAPFSFQGNEKVYLECSKVRWGGGGVNNAEGAITISQSQIVKIRICLYWR